MTIKTTRRTFITQAAIAGAAGPLILSGKARGGSDRKLRHASIGTARRGKQDLDAFITHPDIEIVALCDVDRKFLEQAAKRFPKARLYRDWRKLLENEADRIDSINATVPNHMHAPIATTALRMGKHVYCQKPLTHSIFESRKLAEEAARRPELVTQMGVQSNSDATVRTAVAMLQFGVIGKVKEVHSWDIVRFHYTGAFTDPHTQRRPDKVDPVPDHLDWDLWLGVAPERPHVKDYYHTRWWRRWHDFGGGAQGDMGGHMMDVVFTALELTSPKWIMSHRSPSYEETFSPDNKVQYRFPGTKYTTGDIDYFWYDTGPVDAKSSWPIDQKKKLPGDGTMFVGEKGYMFLPHGSAPQILPQENSRDAVKEFNTQVGWVKGSMTEHYHTFIDACLGRDVKTTTPFEYSGNLTESILMGTVVNRFPKEKLIWDAKALEFTNKPEANQCLRRTYRDGWHVGGLG
jgi:predicted dehydrogenase